MRDKRFRLISIVLIGLKFIICNDKCIVGYFDFFMVEVNIYGLFYSCDKVFVWLCVVWCVIFYCNSIVGVVVIE